MLDTVAFQNQRIPFGDPLWHPLPNLFCLYILLFSQADVYLFWEEDFHVAERMEQNVADLGGPFVSSPVSYRARPVPMAWFSSPINGLKEACLCFPNLVGCHEMGLHNSSWKSPCMVTKRIGTDQHSPVEISYWLTVIYCLSIVFGKCP